jgi:CRP-like cAMP-binding protein
MARRLEISDLQKIPFMSGLMPAELDALMAAGHVREIPAGDLVFRAGDAGAELCVLLDGEVAIELDIAGAPPRILASLSAGTVFGEISFLLGSPRTASARALEDTRVLSFSREDLERVSQAGRQAVYSMVETIARILALRLSSADRDLAEICSRVRAEHPEAAPLLESIEERRRRMQHDWQF